MGALRGELRGWRLGLLWVVAMLGGVLLGTLESTAISLTLHFAFAGVELPPAVNTALYHFLLWLQGMTRVLPSLLVLRRLGVTWPRLLVLTHWAYLASPVWPRVDEAIRALPLGGPTSLAVEGVYGEVVTISWMAEAAVGLAGGLVSGAATGWACRRALRGSAMWVPGDAAAGACAALLIAAVKVFVPQELLMSGTLVHNLKVMLGLGLVGTLPAAATGAVVLARSSRRGAEPNSAEEGSAVEAEGVVLWRALRP